MRLPGMSLSGNFLWFKAMLRPRDWEGMAERGEVSHQQEVAATVARAATAVPQPVAGFMRQREVYGWSRLLL
jgi:hypothetical protein